MVERVVWDHEVCEFESHHPDAVGTGLLIFDEKDKSRKPTCIEDR
jgi:hypothetical protein